MRRNRSLAMLFILSASFLGCEEVLEKPLDEKKAVLVAPKDQLQTTTLEHVFHWEEMEGATKYQLQIVTPAFDDIEMFVEDTTVTHLYFSKTLTAGKYQWRVRAKNGGTASQMSDVRNLEIQE